MGYACPVCGDPQADDEHLSNHLAFSAMLGDDAHESWLAEHAPGWDETDADRLAETVTDHAEAVEYPQVFEDEGFSADAARDRATATRDPDLDAETAEIMEEARELTRRMREDDEDDEGSTDDAAETDDADEAETE